MNPEFLPWVQLAEREVAGLVRDLPPDIALSAQRVPVFFETDPDRTDAHEDILGLFEGPSLRDGQLLDPGLATDEMPRITLFIETLLFFVEDEEALRAESIPDYVEDFEGTFREEVRRTYLHELGHYLGWDEDEVAQRGLA